MQYWAELEVEASGDAQEIAGALLLHEAGCHGWMADAKTVKGYLPVDDRVEGAILRVREALQRDKVPGMGRSITVRRVAEEDWADAWKQFFKPQRIGDRIVVKPTWEEFTPADGDLVLQIDPGMAFGTGLHATTRLCLRALETEVKGGESVADVWTGSGILAVGAALLGAGQVLGTDNDPLAVRIARENIAVNQVQDRVQAEEASLPPSGTFDIVVANILADVILGMRTELYHATKPGGTLISSGIIDTRASDVQSGLASIGFTPIVKQTEGEWVALVARRPV